MFWEILNQLLANLFLITFWNILNIPDLRNIKVGLCRMFYNPEITRKLNNGKRLESLKRTYQRRPDLLKKIKLSAEDKKNLGKIKLEDI